MAEFEPGVEVRPKNGEPYIIAELVGSDYLHVDTQGNYHTLLTQPLRSGRRFYRYYQFDHIDPFARQQLHIYYQKVGAKIAIPADETVNVPKMGEPLPQINEQLKAQLKDPRIVRIPGEVEKIERWVIELEIILQDAAQLNGIGHFNSIKDQLMGLVHGNLGRSIHPLKRSAAENLTAAEAAEDEAAFVRAVSEGQSDLLAYSKEQVGITAASMERYRAIEHCRDAWDVSVGRLPEEIGKAVEKISASDLASAREIVTRPRSGVQAILRDFTGKPYFTTAQRILAGLNKFVEAQQLDEAAELLDTQAINAQVWRSSHLERPGQRNRPWAA